MSALKIEFLLYLQSYIIYTILILTKDSSGYLRKQKNPYRLWGKLQGTQQCVMETPVVMFLELMHMHLTDT